MQNKDEVGVIFQNEYTDREGNVTTKLNGKITCPSCAAITNVVAFDNRQNGNGRPIVGKTGKNQPVMKILKKREGAAAATGAAAKSEDDIPF